MMAMGGIFRRFISGKKIENKQEIYTKMQSEWTAFFLF